jgi:uncharacterized membrane protein
VTAPSAERRREVGRVEAFSDGVMAVIITITALGLQVPAGSTFSALNKSLSGLLVYILSFTYIGIYWNNHHHLFRATERLNGAVMWANLHLLFWLSLVPVLTGWVAKYYHAHLPASIYGIALCGAGVAYSILVRVIVKANGPDSAVARGIGSDLKGNLSIGLYVVAVGLAWVSPWIAYGLYVAVAVIWFVPDRRLTGTGEMSYDS